jgi:hypothetical protein
MAMQKLTLLGALVFSLACGFATTAGAMQISPSVPILMIDGVGDANATVDVQILDTSIGLDFGHYDSSGFNLILDDATLFTNTTFAGGDIVDFAIMDTSTGAITKLSDGTATLDFTGAVLASNSQNPVVQNDYYQSLTITWTIGNNDFVVNLSDIYDGFAPGVPEPSAALVFGLGFVLFERIVRRNTRR